MFTPGFDPMWEYKQRHKELMDEAKHYRLVREALEAGMPKVRFLSAILLQIGKGLVFLGTRLERRYGVQPCGEPA